MIRFIKNLFGGILTFVSNLFSFGKKEKPQLSSNGGSQKSEAPKKDTASQQETKTAKNSNRKAAQPAFFLDSDDARGFKSTDAGSQPSQNQLPTEKAPKPQTTNNGLNMPKPKVTSFDDFSNFGDRRRPGANMSDFLEMARQLKPSRR